MAFFGLTALGPQNPFANASIYSSNLIAFLREDFEQAWLSVIPKDKSCTEAELKKVFRNLFHGPVPEVDARRIDEAFDSIYEGRTMSEFVNILTDLAEAMDKEERRQQERKGAAPSCDFVDGADFSESMKRHKRMPRAYKEKQQYPLTMQQEIGWEKQELQPPVAGRYGSEITKFAAELVKNGILY